jgi:hypothetical protein
MDGVSFQASVSNLGQMDRHQGDTVRTPVINQEQNAVIAGELARQKFIKPAAPDDVEEKKVDPRQRKRDLDKKKDKRKKPSVASEASETSETSGASAPGKATDSGYFLDVNA